MLALCQDCLKVYDLPVQEVQAADEQNQDGNQLCECGGDLCQCASCITEAWHYQMKAA